MTRKDDQILSVAHAALCATREAMKTVVASLEVAISAMELLDTPPIIAARLSVIRQAFADAYKQMDAVVSSRVKEK
jgi:hypothetical protein